MPHDLVVKGGHVLDPGQKLDGIFDIGITGGMISAIEADIPAADARRTVEVRGPNRYVLPGLLDIHTHVAHGATTTGVGMGCVDPDLGGVRSGVTTVVDAGSVGIANVGVFSTHLLPRAKTRVKVFLNVGTYAHTTPSTADYNTLPEIDRKAIGACVQANPGLISGFKVRLVGPVVHAQGAEVVRLCKDIASEHGLPLMVHIGDGRAPDRPTASETTKLMLETFTEGDILTHLCTPHPGGVMDVVDTVRDASARGVVLDSALGRGNFGIETARKQAEIKLRPDTTSSDITGGGRGFGVGLVDSMSKFMAVGYSLSDVVAMTTVNAAKAIGLQGSAGALAVGYPADISIIDVVEGNWKFVDTIQQEFTGRHALVPVHTFRAGEMFAPDWGPYPWGWLPPAA